MTDPPVIRMIGRYELLREIGRGGMATVYLARQIELDRFVAIKELGSFQASDPTIARRFLRESRLAGSFAHTNVVTVFDYFEHDGTPYIAMEYIEGGSLRPYVRSMTLAQVGGVLEGTLAGLAHAQERNVVHRDLKPENVMVTVEGRVKITDFGIAKATDRVRGASVLTQTGMTVGTPMYMAPEQAMGQEIGPWTDLYSVGCMAYELFAGRVPFDDEAPMAILLKHINEEPPPLASIALDVDPEIAAWVHALLVKDVSERPTDANDAWLRFEEILIGKLGPRWRREARLQGVPGSMEVGPPLTPAPFKREPSGPLSVSQYDSFDWSAPRTQVSGPATPLPHDAPPGPLVPRELDVPVGPPTPEPIEIVETYVPAPPPPPPTLLPERPPPPAPPERARRRTGVLVGGGILAAGAVAAVIAVAPGGSENPAPAPTATPGAGSVLAAGPLRVTTASGWKPIDEPLAIEGLALDAAGGAAPGGDPDRGAVLVGTADKSANRADLLSPAFVESLGLRDDVTPERTEVMLDDDVPAYRYADLRPLGFGRFMTLYVAPTTAGVATIACVRPAAATGGDAFAERCDAVAKSLSLAGAEAFPLGPDADYGAAVDAALVALDSRSAARPRRPALRADARAPGERRGRDREGLRRRPWDAGRHRAHQPRRRRHARTPGRGVR